MEEEGPTRKKYLLCIHCDPPAYFPDLAQFGSHVNVRHGARSSLTCGSCRKCFVHKTSLIRHITEQHVKKHEESSSSEDGDGLGGTPNLPDPPSPPSPPNDETASENVADHTGPVHEEIFKDIKTEAAMFLLRLRSSGNMTNASVSLVQDYIAELLVNVLKNVEQNTSQFLTECGIEPDKATDFLSGATFRIENPFQDITSVDDQLHYFCEKFGLVIPDEKYLSSRIENRFDRGRRMFIPKTVLETFQSISLIDSLTFIVRNPFLRNLILSEKASDDGMFRSYLDGSEFKNNPFLQKYPDCIRIILYYDDLEIASALGSKDTIHKLGCFYFAIQNFPPEESSLLSSIFLLALANAEDLKKPGAFRKVLAIFIDELKRLSTDEGIVIDLPNGEKYTLRAILVTVCADALAAHALLGLLSPSADKFCRLCLVTKEDIMNNSAFIGLLRTKELHADHVREVVEGGVLPKVYGVKEESPLVDVMSVPSASTFDAFHDLVGVIHMVLKLALYEYVCVRKLFKSTQFNSNVDSFVYGSPDIKNKPSANFMYRKLCEKGHTMRQYGSQTFCLLRVFPFLVTGVEEGDEILELVFLLQDIVKIILSPKVSPLDVLHLENLVRRHNNRFHELFVTFQDEPVNPVPRADPEGEEDETDNEEDAEEEDVDDPNVEQIQPRRRQPRRRKRLKKGINKLHHLLHYSQQMREKGPVGRLWCAKFEARHRIFRKHSAVQSNFKNPPKTMAKMFQLSTLGSVLARTSWRKPIFPAEKETLLIQNSPYRDSLLLGGFSENDTVNIRKSVDLCGIEYSVDLFVQLKDESNVLPTFAIIIDIIQVVNSPEIFFLAVSKCKNYGLSRRFNSYHISNTFDEETIIVKVADLASHRAIAAWSPVPLPGTSGGPVNLYLYQRYV